MPNRTYITKDEKSVPGHKPMKDRLTLLLGANASGDMKLKPLLDYLDTNDLPLKALLLLDNAPGHPKDLKDNLLTDFPWLTAQVLPPNTTLLIRPMDQEAIAAFKKLYTRSLFRRCFEACQFSSTMTLKKFGKDSVDILKLFVSFKRLNLELEVNEEDIEELIMGHEDELGTEEI
ncbi:tigger transposable element-derived protein 1-like protein [Trichonephila clavipes]|nr:tigger transposable element-derived protein 1-like protein [Trichonephila clavipes]